MYINDKTTTLDNVNSAWLPDVYATYGDNYSILGLDDIRSIRHEIRFMISDNQIYPKVYEVSKVTELVPAGIVKLTMKQVPYNEKRDNVTLGICDYYDENGTPFVQNTITSHPINNEPVTSIFWMQMNENGELTNDDGTLEKVIHLRKPSYFLAFSSDNFYSFIWDIKLVDDGNKYTDEQRVLLEQYMEVTDFNDGSISIKPNRVKGLAGNKFVLSVSDGENGHCSSIVVEVAE